ncbi:MAG: hypothetical protein IKF36_04020 [Bacilli bacterium]|nr:hypothetical protein [Bacilli bacterium]
MKKQKDPSLMTDKELITYCRLNDNDEELQKRIPNIDFNNLKLKDEDLIYLMVSVFKYEKKSENKIENFHNYINNKYNKKGYNIYYSYEHIIKKNTNKVLKMFEKKNFKEDFIYITNHKILGDEFLDIVCENKKIMNKLMDSDVFQNTLLELLKEHKGFRFFDFTDEEVILKSNPEVFSFLEDAYNVNSNRGEKIKNKSLKKFKSILTKKIKNNLKSEQIDELEFILNNSNKEKYPRTLIHSLLYMCLVKEKMFDYYKRLESLIFDGDFKKTVSFCKTYYDQPLFDSIMSLDDSKLVSLKEKLDILSKHNRLENMHNLSDLEEKKVEEIKELKYDEEYKNSTNVKQHPDGRTDIVLFNFPKEIMVINDNGELFDIDAGRDHISSFKAFCRENKIEYPDGMVNEYLLASYLGTKGMSTIVLEYENFLIILSSTASDEVKQKIINLLSTIQVPEAETAIAQIVDDEGNANDFNEGMTMPVSDAIEVLTKLKKEKGKRL